MDSQEKKMETMQSSIVKELRVLFKANMKIFDWSIPENNDKKSAYLIVETMQKALDELKAEVVSGKYDNY